MQIKLVYATLECEKGRDFFIFANCVHFGYDLHFYNFKAERKNLMA